MVRYSHPGDENGEPVPLTNHNADIVDRLDAVVPADARTISGESLRQYVIRLAHVHDAGKLTLWFQQYIDEAEGTPDGPTHHAPMGALLAFYVLDTVGYDAEEALAGYVAVACHHRELPDVAEYVYKRTRWIEGRPELSETQQDVRKQVAHVDDTVPELAADVVQMATSGNGSWSEFVERVDDGTAFDQINHVVSRRTNASEHNISPSFYPLVLQAWRALVLADKTSAASAPIEDVGSTLDRSTLASHIDSLPEDGSDLSDRERALNDLRDEARNAVLNGVNDLTESGTDVATLTLPTGLGKTLTGLEAAFKLRDESGGGRVVYALPFTSIIDQVADIATDIFDTDVHDDELTVHHHLAETLIRVDEGDRPDTDEHADVEHMLGESWRSGMTITTFVQLFESLAGPQNSQSLKIPALYDSVIVLDEPQAIPHTWWPLVTRLVDILVGEFDATVIAMTATQPKLFDRETVELVGNADQFFRVDAVERTEYVLHDSFEEFGRDGDPLEYGRAADELVDSLYSAHSTLAVCNTIDSARELTDAVDERVSAARIGEVIANELDTSDPETIVDDVVERVGGADDPAVLHLSTRWRPRDRLIAIEVANRLTDRDHPLLAVSTQLIEAGVDISFDAVYRDLAPMDSVVQAAGRCNRSFERDRGEVTVWWLAPPGDRETTPSVAVYDKWSAGGGNNSLLRLTRQAIDSVREQERTLPEAAVDRDGVRAYYDLLAGRNPGRDGWVEELDTGQIGALGEHSLIDQRLAVDVVVARTSSESETVERVHELWSNGRYGRARRELQRTRDIRVSVPIYAEDSREARKIRELRRVHPESDLRVLDLTKEEYRSYFDDSTGLVLEDRTVDRRFL